MRWKRFASLINQRNQTNLKRAALVKAVAAVTVIGGAVVGETEGSIRQADVNSPAAKVKARAKAAVAVRAARRVSPPKRQ